MKYVRYPEMTNDLGLEVRDEGPDCVLQTGRRRLCGKSQYCDARVVGRSVPQGIPEFEIEGAFIKTKTTWHPIGI